MCIRDSLFKLKNPELKQAVSLGRVQSPLLSYVVDSTSVNFSPSSRIREFGKLLLTKTYVQINSALYDLHVSLEDGTEELRVLRIFKEQKQYEQAEPLWNTNDAMEHIKMNPDTLMRTMESLYLDGFLTYPRTEERFIPLDYLKELETTVKRFYDVPVSLKAENSPSPKLSPTKTDKWAITLTVEGVEALATGKLRGIRRFVAMHFLSQLLRTLAPPVQYEETYVELEQRPSRKSVRLLWSRMPKSDLFISSPRENFFSYPEIHPGQVLPVRKMKVGYPKEFSVKEAFMPRTRVISRRDMVRWMASVGLGTEATRQEFPTLLHKRNYLVSNIPTILGEVVSQIIEQIGLTKTLTRDMEYRISTLRTLSQMESFKKWISEITDCFISRLKELDLKTLHFKCPQGHPASLFNTKTGLWLKCNTCNRLYPIA